MQQIPRTFVVYGSSFEYIESAFLFLKKKKKILAQRLLDKKVIFYIFWPIHMQATSTLHQYKELILLNLSVSFWKY